MARRAPQPPDRPGEPPDEDDLGVEATEPLSLKDAAANVVGNAMLGLDQALRDGPPPQMPTKRFAGKKTQRPDLRYLVTPLDLNQG